MLKIVEGTSMLDFTFFFFFNFVAVNYVCMDCHTGYITLISSSDCDNSSVLVNVFHNCCMMSDVPEMGENLKPL